MTDRYGMQTRLVEEQIDRIRKLVDGPEERKELDTLKDKLSKGKFNLAVVGQFKRGKTSFINALLGKALLPTAIVPLTSIITIISYAEEENIRVIFLDRTEKIITLDKLHAYITEKENPKNQKQVLLVKIGHPSPYLQEGISLIDTPGIGSTFLHNTAMTYGYLKRIDAAIFLLSADPPVSQNEIDFLKEVKREVPKIFFVLNKIDYLSSGEQEEIVGFNSRTLEKELGEPVAISPVSAKLALNGKKTSSNIEGFKDILSAFFLEEKGEILLQSLNRRLLGIVEEARNAHALSIRVAQMPLEETGRRREAFRETARRIREEQQDAAPLIRAEIERIMEMLDEDLRAFMKKNHAPLLEKLRKAYRKMAGSSNRQLLEHVQRMYLGMMQEFFEPWRAEEEKKVRGRFENIVRRFSETTNGLIERIRERSSTLFETDIGHLPTGDVFTLESALDYRIDEMFRLLGDELRLLMPKFAFRKMLWKQIEGNVAQQLDMNAGRIRSDFLERLNNSAFGFIETMDARIGKVVQNIDQAVTRGMEEQERHRGEVAAFIKEHEESMAALDRAGSRLRKGSSTRFKKVSR